MAKFIEEFYYGNLDPQAQQLFNANKKYPLNVSGQKNKT